MTHPLEIRLLGQFEVLVGGQPANVSGGKRQGLLALLALRRGRVVGVDSLIDALWGDDLPAAPRNAVQHHIARLRGALGQETIVASPDGYALTDAAVDAVRFEELVGQTRSALRAGDAGAAAEAVSSALELWRGPTLRGLTETAWFSAEARRLESLRVDALEEQFEAALALGDHREIVTALRAALVENPFRERFWGQLMLALYRNGRQPDALEAFGEARRVLSEELALEPGPDLRRLQEAILAHDPAIAPVAVAPRRRGNLPAPSTSFVGREQEVAQVVELLREHRLVTLTGPPGVGKSRLAVEVARLLEAEAGVWRVVLARAGGPDDVARLVAAAVDARGADPLARAIARLRDGDAVLLLDACEPVVHEAARVAATVLAECPDVRVLARGSMSRARCGSRSSRSRCPGGRPRRRLRSGAALRRPRALRAPPVRAHDERGRERRRGLPPRRRSTARDRARRRHPSWPRCLCSRTDCARRPFPRPGCRVVAKYIATNTDT